MLSVAVFAALPGRRLGKFRQPGARSKYVPPGTADPTIAVNASGVWHPSPGFAGTATAPGRVALPGAGDHYGIGLGCKSFETPNCNIEWDEWNIARGMVTKDDTVIEFGARYGTTSCALAEATGNSGRVVSVEPDSRAHEMMLRNRQKNNCNFHAVFGTVSDKPIVLGRLSPFHYNQMTRAAKPADVKSGAAVAHLPYQQVELRVGSKFTAVLLDCEGCIA
jgi:FkbM family methyltransferase